jgi:hypothetical protein
MLNVQESVFYRLRGRDKFELDLLLQLDLGVLLGLNLDLDSLLD